MNLRDGLHLLWVWQVQFARQLLEPSVSVDHHLPDQRLAMEAPPQPVGPDLGVYNRIRMDKDTEGATPQPQGEVEEAEG